MGDFDDWTSALKTIAIAAGASLSPTITDVAVGMPVPRGRCIRVSWAGEVIPPPNFAMDLAISGKQIVGYRFLITGFWPVPDFAEEAAANRQDECVDFASAIRTGILADRSLGGKASGVLVEEARFEFPSIGGGLYATVDCPVIVGHIEYGA